MGHLPLALWAIFWVWIGYLQNFSRTLTDNHLIPNERTTMCYVCLNSSKCTQQLS